MAIAASKKLTLEEYLAYNDGTDTHYELEDGVLVEMGAEDPINNTIVSFLFATFLGLGIPHHRFAIGHQIVLRHPSIVGQ